MNKIISIFLFTLLNAISINAFEVTEFTVCKQIIDREPIQSDSIFQLSDKMVHVFCRLGNIQKEDSIHYQWYFNDKQIHTFTTEIKPSARWRSWSTKKLYENKGTWNVKLTNNQGEIVAEKTFTVQ